MEIPTKNGTSKEKQKNHLATGNRTFSPGNLSKNRLLCFSSYRETDVIFKFFVCSSTYLPSLFHNGYRKMKSHGLDKHIELFAL